MILIIEARAIILPQPTINVHYMFKLNIDFNIYKPLTGKHFIMIDTRVEECVSFHKKLNKLNVF